VAGITDDDARANPPPTAPAAVTGGMTPDIASPYPDEPAGEPQRRQRRSPVAALVSEPMWVLGLVVLMDEMDKNIVAGMVTPLKEHFGVGDRAIGVLFSLQLLFNGLITVPAGYLADRWNRKQAMGRTVVAWSALTAAGATAVTFPMLVGLRSMLGFGQAISEPSAASLIGDYYPSGKRGRAFSLQQVMLLAGTGMGIGLGGLISTTLGWRAALVIVALPGLLVASFVFRLREPKRGTADLMAALGGGEIEHSDGTEVKLFEHGFRRFLSDMVDGLRADMRTILKIRTMRYALVGVAALLFTVTALTRWMPQYYERHLHLGVGRGEGLFALLVVLGGVPGVLFGGRVADRWAPKMRGGRLALPAIFLFVGCAFFTGSYFVRADEYSTSAIAGASILQLVGMFIITMAVPGLRAGLTDALPAHLRGAGFGAFNLVAVIFGQAAAPTVVSLISSAYDENLRVAFLAVAPLSFLGAGVLFRARKFLDEDMQKIMMAVLTAMQEERDRTASGNPAS
jgi:MFS transporter, Spinster family, sphingosine-1-phosphate transporter